MQEAAIHRGNFEERIKSATQSLLEMARKHSWNEISDELKYVIRKIEPSQSNYSNSFEAASHRKKILESKSPLNLSQAIKELIVDFENIYLIELYVFKSSKEVSIIEILFLEKSGLEEKYRNSVKENAPMLHCKVPIPPYISSANNKKFDINWQLETIEHRWKMFWWKWRKKKF